MQQSPHASRSGRISGGAAHDAAVLLAGKFGKDCVQVGKIGDLPFLEIERYCLIVTMHAAIRADQLAKPPATRLQNRYRVTHRALPSVSTRPL
jgi:hypothetical protein